MVRCAMTVFHCKMCGGNLDVHEGMRICKCSYCDSFQTVPDISSENKLRLFKRANELRFQCSFDRAAEAYEDIIAGYPDEAEAYWGACLCRYGIEYVDDPKTGMKMPTCHRTSFESILDNKYFRLAIENSDYSTQKLYRAEAEIIDAVQKNILAVAAGEEPFDVFICYKETDGDERTADSLIAQNIYERLTEKGMKVFFARETLKSRLGQEYEPYIFSAINSAAVMIAVGTKPEYFDSVWVKNEWSRFMGFMKRDKNKMLIPCFKNMSAIDLPDELQGFQAQDMSQPDAVENLLSCVSEAINAVEEQENKLGDIFSSYEMQLRNERAKLKRLDDEMHRKAVEEKANAEKLYRKERLPVGLLIVLDFFASFLFTFITLGVMAGFDFERTELIFAVWAGSFILPVIIGAPYVIKRNRAAKEKLYERLSYDENAPSYDSGSSKQRNAAANRDVALKLYSRERVSGVIIGALIAAHLVLAIFGAAITCVALEDIIGPDFNDGLVIALWYVIPPVIAGAVIRKINKRAKERLEKRLSGEEL